MEIIIENNFSKKDPETPVFVNYTALVTALIHFCKREPEKETGMTEMIEVFIKYFIKVYRMDE